jgi:Holliday junction resolvasome RuvABC DNA-binding subunit
MNAVMDRVEIEVGDVVIAMSDGVSDNLWEHEIVEKVLESLKRWEEGHVELDRREDGEGLRKMGYVAQELVKAARQIAQDPFAESPYMEKAVEEGLSIEGGSKFAFMNSIPSANIW